LSIRQNDLNGQLVTALSEHASTHIQPDNVGGICYGCRVLRNQTRAGCNIQ
jgi:hypothetical protein